MKCTPFVRQYGILSNKWGAVQNLRRFSFDFKGGEYLDQEAKAVC